MTANMTQDQPQTSTVQPWQAALQTYILDKQPYSLIRCEQAADGALHATFAFTAANTELVKSLQQQITDHVSGESRAGS